jgi:ABC-type phosphate transport system substrate-binding protein
MLSVRKCKETKFLFVMLLVIFSFLSIVKNTNANNSLAAEAFDYTHNKVDMPVDWQQQPVIHSDVIKNADLVISLGQQTYPALKSFVQTYATKNKIKIVIQQGTCGVTAGKLRKKLIDIGAYCCPVAVSDRLPSLEIHTIGIAPISLLTHSSNPLNDISIDDARKVYQGTYRRWSQLPATDTKLTDHAIQPVVRLHCKKRPGHWRALLKNEDLFSPTIFEVGVVPDMIKQVATNPNAIGYETVYMLKVHKKNGDLKMLSINGLKPTDLDSAAQAKYPVYRTYSLTTWKDTVNEKSTLALIKAIEKHIENNTEKFGIVPVATLRKNGWLFHEDELIAEPDGKKIISQDHNY